MNILFLTLTNITSVNQKGIYTDLIRALAKKHSVYAISMGASENGSSEKAPLRDGNITIVFPDGISARGETNIIKKGVNLIRMPNMLKKSLIKALGDVKFDLIVYATPPITFYGVVKYFRKKNGARTYLMLKDIFPQNAVDIGMLRKSGIKGLIYRFFRFREKQLYKISDYIGCMSPANVEYMAEHNPSVKHKLEICPNSVEPETASDIDAERNEIREKYGLPIDKKIFIYGGNLGKPQGIPFIQNCLKTQIKREDAYFVIVGDGTEFQKLRAFFDSSSGNMELLSKLPRDEYERLVSACDVGLLFLDYRFTIPNFPSRLLSYMQAGIPVLACTDTVSDIKAAIEEANCGLWCESNNAAAFDECVEQLCNSLDCRELGKNGNRYLLENYTVDKSYNAIMRHFE